MIFVRLAASFFPMINLNFGRNFGEGSIKLLVQVVCELLISEMQKTKKQDDGLSNLLQRYDV